VTDHSLTTFQKKNSLHTISSGNTGCLLWENLALCEVHGFFAMDFRRCLCGKYGKKYNKVSKLPTPILDTLKWWTFIL